ncbi:unnamed protein product [Closterium sp. NIES-54]
MAGASLSFTLDSGAFQCFFCNHTTLIPLLAPVPVALANPTSGPAVTRTSITLSCPDVPFCSLIGLHIPSFSMNLVGVGHLQDYGVIVTFPAHARFTTCTNAAIGSRLATFSREPRSGRHPGAQDAVQTPWSASRRLGRRPDAQVSVQAPKMASPTTAGRLRSPHTRLRSRLRPSKDGANTQLPLTAAAGLVVALCICRSLSHPTVLWPPSWSPVPSTPHMSSHCLVSGLPFVFASLPPLSALACTPCVEGSLRPTPHPCSLRMASAPLQNLHLDVWGPTPCPRPEGKNYFLVVVDDFTRYTTVFPVWQKFDVNSTLIPWLLATSAQCGLVMEISRTSMIHAHAPHFLWPYVVRYATHQLKLWPCVVFPEVSPTCLWTGSPGIESNFHVWGWLAHVHDTSADKLLCAATGGSGAGGACSGGTGVAGTGTGGAGTGGIGAGGTGSGGAGYEGARAGDADTGGASSRSVGARGAVAGGADSEGAGAGGDGAGGADSEGAGSGYGASSTNIVKGAGAVGTGAAATAAAAAIAAAEATSATASAAVASAIGAAAAAATSTTAAVIANCEWSSEPSSPPGRSLSPPAYGPTFPTPDSSLAVFSPPQSRSSPVIPTPRTYTEGVSGP